MTKYQQLIKEVDAVNDQGITIDHAERVAGLALSTMNELSEQLAVTDKARRMRKAGLKAIRAITRQEEIKKHDKKPTESQLDDVLTLNGMVQKEEDGFDEAEVETELLERQFGISKESHLYFRSISKGRFE